MVLKNTIKTYKPTPLISYLLQCVKLTHLSLWVGNTALTLCLNIGFTSDCSQIAMDNLQFIGVN